MVICCVFDWKLIFNFVRVDCVFFNVDFFSVEIFSRNGISSGWA